MAPGNRLDTLKEGIGFYNRRLFDSAAKSLIKKVDSRIDQAKLQLDLLRGGWSIQQVEEMYVEERRRPTGIVGCIPA